MSKKFLFTSESVSEGHPDKICDQISDAILDAHLARNPHARVACETLVTTNHVTIAGEIKDAELSEAEVDAIVRGVIRDIGYEQDGFHWENLEIVNRLHSQSADIAQGVDAATGAEEGAGDQGIMFGYACSETAELMPAPILYAHKILETLSRDRKAGFLPELGPDAKSQVTCLYENGRAVGIDTVVVSTQHGADVSPQTVEEIIRGYVTTALPKEWDLAKARVLINPTGRFVVGGPDGDTGLTGRKIVVDTYGGAAPHGGGAFSGKDPTKVDRSAAYAARYLAKNVVAAGLAARCQIQLAYAIGVAAPVAIYCETFGTSLVPEADISRALRELMHLTPSGIASHLDLWRPIYRDTAAYGHFGRAPTEDGFGWERTDLVLSLRARFPALVAAE
ncbi:methionine adenosyltransferase [Aliiroseovarius crassostreae]|uniref:S-adenosylmethionine synthase n=2 Tax=Aliiroseovarius crassostreae TaxID=154981 RepID=A0A0P7JKA5_9RHOB|nr:methionine adenosyltransferase [Aliiroseovarius crassostreae]KPN61545.1 S-adenosylmethionine synthetase [Aliiroseovarius crassostreae]SFU92674.1 methionine adenosyltransferase [Aliiroseovarius crassostreae]